LREAFGSWGAELDPEAFGRALLALGLSSRAALGADAAALAAQLFDRWQARRDRPMPWRLAVQARTLERSTVRADTLAEAGRLFVARVREVQSHGIPPLRLELVRARWIDAWDQLVSVLRGAGADAVYIRDPLTGDGGWGWPLRIAAAEDLRELLSQHHWNGPIYQCASLTQTWPRPHVMVLDRTLPDAVDFLADERRASAEVLLVLGGLGDAGNAAKDLAEQAATQLMAEGVVVLDRAAERADVSDLVFRLVGELSHAMPLDVAAGRMAEHSTPFVVASRELVAESSLRRQARHVANRLRRMGRAAVPVPGRAVHALHLPRARLGAPDAVPSIRADRLGGRLRPGLEEIGFDRESDAASVLGDLVETAGAEMEQEEARREGRHLQATIQTRDGSAVSAQQPILPGGHYKAAVRIAQHVLDGWVGLVEPFEGPPPRPDGQPHRLSVLFWEPVVSRKPRLKTLLLPPRGDTRSCEFPFEAPDRPMRLAARIAVFYRNRNLQTGVLRASVGRESPDLEFVVDAAPFPQFTGLAERNPIGASLILNRDDAGASRAFVYADDRADQVEVSASLPSLDQLTESIGNAITAITTEPEKYAGLRAEGTLKLLRDMAQHGGNLLQMLKRHTLLGDSLDAAEHLQIVAARVEAFLPAEFLYGGEIPRDDAVLCGGAAGDAEAALERGVCCGAYAADPKATVCPLRFWSLSKIIERHAHLPEHSLLRTDFRLKAAPPTARSNKLTPLAGAVLAASDRANNADPDTVTELRARVERVVVRKPLVVPGDWQDWVRAIESEKPGLLVLVPHHGRDGGFDYLEIGAAERCKSVHIDETFVRAESTLRPIVLLIGCETSEARLELEGFIPRFQLAGAAIIVSTIASILGRQAGPAASLLVEELDRASEQVDVPFGRILLSVRRKLLSQGTPMVLGLTSYGDADWLIARQA
jgi:hypothetical protein